MTVLFNEYIQKPLHTSVSSWHCSYVKNGEHANVQMFSSKDADKQMNKTLSHTSDYSSVMKINELHKRKHQKGILKQNM